MSAQTAKSQTKKNDKQISIRLKKGLIATNDKQRQIVRGLGLRKRESISTLENTSSIRGMIKKVLHLVEVVSETK